MTIEGFVALDDDIIGNFEVNYRGDISVVLTSQVYDDITDVLELATSNGMTVSLMLKPDFDGHVPQHRQDLDTPS